MSDNVSLSRSNPSMVTDEEGARSDLSAPVLVLPHKPVLWVRESKNHAKWYQLDAVICNRFAIYDAQCWPRRRMPLCVAPRYRDRAGKLDYFLLETLPGGQS